MTSRMIRAGTRGSALALWQTEFIIAQLRAAWPDLACQVETITSRGDRDQQTPLPALGGKGLFTAELEAGLWSGRMDIAVHSLKDLPIEDPPGLVTAAILARDEARDVLISRSGATLDDLPANAVIGTSSTRRSAQILARRPDLHIRTIRGNVDTRLRKLDEGQYDAIVLAGAGVVRMGLAERVNQWLPVEWFTPAPGQGALAVQCRADDTDILNLLDAIHDPNLATRITAERQFLAALGGGCSEPVGAFARVQSASAARREQKHDSTSERAEGIHLQAWYSTPDGQRVWCESVEGTEPCAVARLAAQRAQEKVGSRQPVGDSHSNSFVSYESRPKVVLTRSLTDDLAACRLLLAAGLQPVVAPVIEMKPELTPAALVEAIDAPERYDWLVFTSSNAVRIFCELLGEQPHVLAALRKLPVAAVGPMTAQAAQDAGFAVQLVPSTYTADALAAQTAPFKNRRVLIPRSAAGRGEWIARLASDGARITEIPLYRPQAKALDAHTLQILAQGFDVMTFASGSAAHAWLAEVERHPALEPLLRASRIACIGPQTAAVVAESGLPVSLVSPVHTMDGLIQAVAESFSQKVL